MELSMKTKKLEFIGITILVLAIAGCGNPGTSASENASNPVTLYSGDIQDKGENLRYELSVSENGTCLFDQYYLNDDGSYVLYHSEGTASPTDYGFYVLYTIGGAELYGEIYTDGEIIIGAYSDYLDTENEYTAIVGMYDCADDDSILLSVKQSGEASLLIGDTLFENTNLFIYEDNWDLMVFSSDNEILFDWLVTFNDDGTFEYVDYTEYVFEKFVGDYECTGPLGDFILSIDGKGGCTATVTIDGKEMDFTGIATVYEDSVISGYLESSEGYTLNLSFEDNIYTEKKLTYTGNYTVEVSD